METKINNGHRVFQVVTAWGGQVFCNLHDIPQAVDYLNAMPGQFTIYHFWNNKPERMTKANLRDMFETAGIKQSFLY